MAALPGAGWEEGAGRARPQGLEPAGGARSPGGRGPGAPRLTQSCPPPELGSERALSSVVLLTARSTPRVWTGPPSRGSRRGLPCAVAPAEEARNCGKLAAGRRRASRIGFSFLPKFQALGSGPGPVRSPPGRRWTRTRSGPETARGRGPGGGRFRAPPEAIRAGPGRTSRPAPLPARRARAGAEGPGWLPGLLEPGPPRGGVLGALPEAASGWFRLVSFLRLTLAACRSEFLERRSRLSPARVCELRTGPHPRVQSVGPGRGRKVLLAGTRASSFVASHASVERLDCLSTWGLTRGPRHTWRVYLLEQRQDLGKIIVFTFN